MTRDEIVAALRAMPETATEPRLLVVANMIERGDDTDPTRTLLRGLQTLAHDTTYDPAQVAAFHRTVQASERDAWRAVARSLSPEAEALFNAEYERLFREGHDGPDPTDR